MEKPYTLSQNDYYRARKFLIIRATEPGPVRSFRALEDLSLERQRNIIAFLKYQHHVKIM